MQLFILPFIFFILFAQLTLANLSNLPIDSEIEPGFNFDQQMKKSDCAGLVEKKILPKYQRQFWFPISIALSPKEVQFGISYRNTNDKVAFELWSKNGSTFLKKFRLGVSQVQIMQWDSRKACSVSSRIEPHTQTSLPERKMFSDLNLQKIISGKKWGVIYIWSPYMPLSVKAIPNIKEAVKSKGGRIEILLDGKANPKTARSYQIKGLVTASELRQVASEEIYARNIFLHYPAALFYMNGFLSTRTYIGYKSVKDYQKWIDHEIALLKRERQ